MPSSPRGTITAPAARTVDDRIEAPEVESGMGKLPGLQDVTSDLELDKPEVMVDVNRDTAAALGVSVDDVRSTLYSAFGARQVSTIYTASNDYQVILEVEAATYHAPTFARYASDYGPGMAEMIRRGLVRSATEYVTANRARLAFREVMIPLLEAHDALLSPAAPGTAPAGLGWTGDASLCAPWSSAGVPSLSLPTGVDAAGLPLALQLVQAPGGLARLLGVAAWCEGVVRFAARPGAAVA